MENYVSEQLTTLAYALLLGGSGAWIYDLLRTIRSRRCLTHLTDAVYALLWLYGLLRFALYRGEGELRLYVLLGAAAGAAAYWLLAAPLLRPVWDFWRQSGAMWAELLLYPLRIMAGITKKIAASTKKCFSIAEKYATMKMHKWDFVRIRRRNRKKGARHERQKDEKKAP